MHGLKANGKMRTRRLNLEALEGRAVPAYYLVMGTGDDSGLLPTSGTGTASHPFEIASLRSAIERADASPHTADIIRFDSELLNSTITLSPDNPPLTFSPSAKTTIQGMDRNVTIDGDGTDRFQRVFEVQPGASAEIDDVTVQNGYDDEPADNSDGDVAVPLLGTLGGGGIHNAGTLILTGVTVAGNTSVSNSFGGGGIFNDVGAKLTMTTCVVDNNSGNSGSEFDNEVPGGGIENRGTMTITATTVANNSASSSGGGIDNSGTLTIKNSTISGNQSSDPSAEYGGGGDGGGVANTGKLTMTNVTISQNFNWLSGGGIDNSGAGSVVLLNCTITENMSGTGGGIHVTTLAAGKTFKMRNTIVSGNGNSDESPDDIAGSGEIPTIRADDDRAPVTISATYCLIGNFYGVTLIGKGNQLNVTDPKLGPLQDNGGPTQTQLPDFDSPAVNMGDPNRAGLPATDQRGVGFPRVSGGRVDIGAVELILFVPPPGETETGEPSGDRRYH